MKKPLFLPLLLILSACMPGVEDWQMATDAASSREIIKRASLDLNCPIPDISAKRIAGAIVGNIVFGAPNGTWVAEGCGKKGTYQVMCSGQVLDAINCNPMLESTQSAMQIQGNASNNAIVATQQAQQQHRQMQQQQQQAEAFRKQQQASLQRMNESQRQSDYFRQQQQQSFQASMDRQRASSNNYYNSSSKYR